MAPRVENEQQEQDSFGSCISDSEGMTSGFDSGSSGSGGNLMRLSEEDEEHILLKHKLYSSLKSSAKYCTVVAAYKNMNSSDSTKARLEAFRFYCESMADKRGGQQNIKHAWYGTSKDGINQIICHGFDICEATEDSGLYGHGLYLSPDNCAIDSVVSAVIDKDGLRHVLFCSVILGNTEEVLLGSGQAYPSSEEFNSGVDNKEFPKRYHLALTCENSYMAPVCRKYQTGF